MTSAPGRAAVPSPRLGDRNDKRPSCDLGRRGLSEEARSALPTPSRRLCADTDCHRRYIEQLPQNDRVLRAMGTGSKVAEDEEQHDPALEAPTIRHPTRTSGEPISGLAHQTATPPLPNAEPTPARRWCLSLFRSL